MLNQDTEALVVLGGTVNLMAGTNYKYHETHVALNQWYPACYECNPEGKNNPSVYRTLAVSLCVHAQDWGYDHGASPTIDWNVGACPRHVAMAQQIVGTDENIR
jgi:hypothetical protein